MDFDAQQDSLFLDGMSFPIFLSPALNCSHSILSVSRCCAARRQSLYGGSAPGGLVNAVSKLPPAEPIRYIEAGVNNFGNAYTQFDFGGPVATQPGNGKLLYRIVGQVQGGGTQTTSSTTTIISLRRP